jgi:hypothetical protein
METCGQDRQSRPTLVVLQPDGQSSNVARHKSKAGQPMNTLSLTPQDLQNIRELAAQWGQVVARRAVGAAGLTEGIRATLLVGHRGAITYHEPVCHCPPCRRDFFLYGPPCPWTAIPIPSRAVCSFALGKAIRRKSKKDGRPTFPSLKQQTGLQ